jgi:hypothetical protein
LWTPSAIHQSFPAILFGLLVMVCSNFE